MELGWITRCVREAQYWFSHHADSERQEEDLSIAQIEQSILSGRILENYPDTGRGRSCLVAGFADDGTPIHAICGMRGRRLVIITVYVPKPPKFVHPFHRG